MIYSLSSELYEELAARVVEAAGDENYFSGSLEFVFGDVECRFVGSLIIYRTVESLPEGARQKIVRMVPVWWEFHTSDINGEHLNNCDFSELHAWISTIA